MNKAHRELLRKNYEKACTDYLNAFLSMYKFRCLGFWVANEIGNIYFVADYYFQFRDIMTAVDMEAKEEDLFAWYDYSVLTAFNTDLNYITLHAWLSGQPHPTKEEVDMMYNEQMDKLDEEIKKPSAHD